MPEQRHATRAQAEAAVQQMLDAGLPENEIRAAMADVVIDGQETIPSSKPQTWWDKHPRTREIVRGALNTLPVMGAVVGGIAGGGTTLGAGTIPGAAVGAGVGEAAREAIGESTGVNRPTSMAEKGVGILGTAAGTGAMGLAQQGLTNAVLEPTRGVRMIASRIPGVRTAMDVAEALGGRANIRTPLSPAATTRAAEAAGMTRPSIATSPEFVNSPLGRALQPNPFQRPLSPMPPEKPAGVRPGLSTGTSMQPGSLPSGPVELQVRPSAPNVVAPEATEAPEIDLTSQLGGRTPAQARATERFGRAYTSEGGPGRPSLSLSKLGRIEEVSPEDIERLAAETGVDPAIIKSTLDFQKMMTSKGALSDAEAQAEIASRLRNRSPMRGQ